jgi:hypothetical protein
MYLKFEILNEFVGWIVYVLFETTVSENGLTFDGVRNANHCSFCTGRMTH